MIWGLPVEGSEGVILQGGLKSATGSRKCSVNGEGRLSWVKGRGLLMTFWFVRCPSGLFIVALEVVCGKMTHRHGKNKASHWLEWAEKQDAIYFQISKKISSLQNDKIVWRKTFCTLNHTIQRCGSSKQGQPYCQKYSLTYPNNSIQVLFQSLPWPQVYKFKHLDMQTASTNICKRMGCPQELREFQRGTVIGCYLCSCEISSLLNIPQSTVSGIITSPSSSEMNSECFSIPRDFGQFHAPNFVEKVWGLPLPVPTWLRTSAQSKVHKDINEKVWCGRTWLANTESWPQPDRPPLGWIRAEAASQAFSSNISVWPHKCASRRMVKNSHKHTPKPCGKLAQKSWSCYSCKDGNTPMCVYV